MYDRSINKLKYLSVAVNALKRLKNQSSVSVKGGNLQQLSECILNCFLITCNSIILLNMLWWDRCKQRTFWASQLKLNCFLSVHLQLEMKPMSSCPKEIFHSMKKHFGEMVSCIPQHTFSLKDKIFF